ncbi:PAS domain-containing protein [Candidatus Nitrosarchaeum limnium]|jgi:PAS domain S-box-containing protein|uniref:PAS domain S-box n=1 Tax=Candidatus Nitrosarchaeum limnium BG20 TaxID=859192 RepID=S2E9S4_9ARCH|nr:PAS domain-containing protein [Candidatus Nitrosarchaeum limnium]EPA06136.1 PAS domain S-box [Candidatus Nitrosarchaeum limnium BG20]
MLQTEARKILKDAPIMWRRINSIGIILDCNSTYANKLGYAKSEILGKSIFEHVPKDSWEVMNDSLKAWFETGKVTDRKITFKKQDGNTFPGILQATSLYDEKKNLLGSNTVIFDISELKDEKIKSFQEYFKEAKEKLDDIKNNEYSKLDENSKSEYDGLKKMFDMLLSTDLKKLNKN